MILFREKDRRRRWYRESTDEEGSLTEKKLTGRVGEKMTPTPRRLLECFRGREAKSVQSAQVV